MGSLKSFIKSVRKAKTIADERTVVRKESAAIRTAFRDPNLDQTTRRTNIAKLLYLYILGEKTHFGQVECLKLLASPRFADKRLGYLAVMLLLDENQEVLTLLTNSLDNDMQHPNMFVVGLALTCLGNIASPELARDLHANVDKILKTTSSVYLKKKAAIVSAKLVAKEPELVEVFLPHCSAMLSERQPAVLLGGLRMASDIYKWCPAERGHVVKFIPRLVGHLKRISTSGYLPDYDVAGVADPFLQVALLDTLRLLAQHEAASAYLEQINDVLTQVASNVDSGKNAAHAILYECIRTIFAIRADQSLRVLGVNLLGKFLLTKDNNIRYVALEMLLVVVQHEPLAVQRHRNTIVGCLGDGDISIRRRALELAFAIANEQNIRVLMREILSFLESAEDDLKPYVSGQIAVAAAKYAPSEKWHFDTLVRMLRLSGNFVTSDICSSILGLVMKCSSTELKKHVVSRLFAACLEDRSQYALALVTTWCIGEYADLALGADVEVHGKSENFSEKAVLDLLHKFINNSDFSEPETVQLVSYILTAVAKLSVKFKSSENVEQLRLILNARQYDTNLEIQTRAVEFQQLFGQEKKLRAALLAHMPPPPLKERHQLSLYGDTEKPVASAAATPSASGKSDDLLDLIDDPSNTVSSAQSGPDPLADIFSQPSQQPQQPSKDSILDLFDAPAPVVGATNTPPAQPSFSGTEAYNDGNLRVVFGAASVDAGAVAVEAAASAVQGQIDKVQLLFAVPKTQKLQISTISGSDSLISAAEIRQALKISGKPGSKVKLRVKVRYNLNGEQKDSQFDYAGIDEVIPA